MHIAFLTLNYPTPARPTVGTFVQQFVWAMARQGHRCSVINPASLHHKRFGALPPEASTEQAGQGSQVAVYRPRFLSLSSRDCGVFHTGRWTQRVLNSVSIRAVRKLPSKPDIVYGHFLYHCGRNATVVGNRLGIPSVIGVGEGTFWTVKPFGFRRARRDFATTTGFIAVASHIRQGLVDQIGVAPEKILLAPNGVDLSRFVAQDRQAIRRELKIPTDLFLIAFVGTFDDLKGGTELVQATSGLDGVGLAMIGQGDKLFEGPQIIHRGRLRHDMIPKWLSAADIFVLPTREEGSCNAVIEALACGLPIVTSSGDYMNDIVDDQVALRVDPTDVQAIRQAIITLKNDPERRTAMARACLEKAGTLDINKRAQRVTQWLEALVQPGRVE